MSVAAVQVPADGKAMRKVTASMLMTLEQLRTEQDIGVLIGQAEKADAAVVAVRQLFESADAADEARVELARISLYARYRAGKRLAELSAGGRGQNGKSPRRVVCESAGLSRQQALRLVRFASMPEDRVSAAIVEIEKQRRAPTVSGVLKSTPRPTLVRQGGSVSVSKDVLQALTTRSMRSGETIRSITEGILRAGLGLDAEETAR